MGQVKRRLSDVVKARVHVTQKGRPWQQTRHSERLTDTRLKVEKETLLFEGARYTRVDLSRQTFENYIANGSVFDACDFRHSTWGGGVLGDLPPTKYVDCEFTGADLRQVGPRFARFERCRFVNARIDDWDALCAEFVGCVFAGRIVRAKFSATPWGFAKDQIVRLRDKNEFRNNNLAQAELVDCSIMGGIDLEANVWPAGDDYIILRSAQDKIEAAKRRLPELPTGIGKDAAAVLEIYSRGAFRLQRDLLVRRNELGAAGPLLLGDSRSSH